ncbi:MAG: type I-C CRISPR-associated protein Cas8c/Csd1 [Firmicutes bacterium]|nr:type I-C CRISPR-associated protein Cas8c/Csd1 [Bacillota bacterium]
MSWFGNLTEAYDRVVDIVGIPDEKVNVLLPLYHMMAKTDVCIAIDASGKFLRADSYPLDICIPCTENSSTRTGSIEPHPLHEQLIYLAFDKKKLETYLSRLREWSDYHPKVKAVYEYVASGSILEDLQNSEIPLDVNLFDENGAQKSEQTIKKEQEKINKIFIRFRVEILGDLTPNLWEDKTVWDAWQRHYQNLDKKEETMCYVTGKILPPTVKHPKGTNMNAYGAKLVSCNDETNYTYKGRFKKSDQPNAISMVASQKAHAMLKYLVAKHGHKCDTQVIVAWATDNGDEQLDPFASTLSAYGSVMKNEEDIIQEAHGELSIEYAKNLRRALSGMGNARSLTNTSRRVAVMAMDAATTGRMSITFYQNLPQNEYIERVLAWHESCSWWVRHDGQDYVSTPSANRIIAAVYGEPKGEGYKKIQKQARERLLHHIVCGQPLDRGWISSAVARVSQPFSYNKQDGGWDIGKWSSALGVTCAVVRKYYKKEEFDLELDKTCIDRGYLYGRLLAIADRLESHARFLQEGRIGGTDKRPTNAVRYMSAFASKPLRTWKLIFDQLNPYIQRLNGAEWYQQQIDEVMSLFEANALDDRPLDGKYLLGYSLQRRAFKNDNRNQEDENNEPNEEN